MILNTFTSFIDIQSSEEISDLKLVMKNYIISELFFIDVLSTFPLKSMFFFITDVNFQMFLTFLGLLKMQRLRRIEKLISHLSCSSETKALLKIIKMVFFLVLYLHIVACLWRFVLGDNFSWIPPTDFIYAETKLEYNDMFDQYMSMLYHAVMIFGLNEVAPVTSNHILFIIVVMVVSALANSFIFGELASLMGELTSRESELNETIDNVYTIMTDFNIQKTTKKSVRLYLLQTNKDMNNQQEFIEFNQNITTSMRNKIQHFSFFRMLVECKSYFT